MHVMVDTRTKHVRGTAAEWNIVVYMSETKVMMSSNNSVHSMPLCLRRTHAAAGAHGIIFFHAAAQAKYVPKSCSVAKYMFVPKSCGVAKIN